ncbi:MAG: GerW family sporulation protein [Burkholderiales bacterium]
MEQSITQYVDTLFVNMENFSQKDGLIGKPVTQGDKTFLPVMSLTLGYGGGDTQAKSKQSTGNASNMGGGVMGGALGIGAKLSTDAVIVIDKGNVLMAPLGAAGSMGQVINKIPQIISSLSPQSGQQGTAQQSQQSQQSAGQTGQQSGSQNQNKSMF